MAVAADPRKLLLPDPDYKESFLSKKFVPIFTTVLGVVAVVGSRYSSRKPIFSGIQHHLLSGALAGAIGAYAQKAYDDYVAEKDAIYHHYIQLHPEYFPVPERKKIGDIFPKFVPIR